MYLKVKIGIYGMNGHQIHALKHEKAFVTAYAGCDREFEGLKSYGSLEDMLKDPEIDLISLCSPRRADQAKQAIACMEAGKHVYAEKPCAMSIEDLDKIIETSKRTGKIFHEMAGTALGQPYAAIRDIVADGVVGEIVQTFSQKSYPWHDGRPADENDDGGLIGQNGIHAVRFIEHVTGRKIVKVAATETEFGNPEPDKNGGLKMAASLIMELDNGGVASSVVNYLNFSKGFGSWGNEHLRIFGKLGFVETVDAGARTRLVVGNEDRGAVVYDKGGSRDSFFDMMIDQILGVGEPPFTIEDELHPTRVVITAKRSALQGSEKLEVK